jgi:WD40 repeat protein
MQHSSDSSHTRLSVQPAGILRGHDGEESIWLSPDGRRLLSTATPYIRHSLVLWDTIEQKRLKQLEEHQDQVLACAYSQEGRFFATACEDGVVRVWTIDGELLMGLSGHERGARGVAFVTSSLLLTCDNTGIVRLWDLSTRQVLLAQSGSPHQDDSGVQDHHASPPLYPMTYAPEHGLLAINHPSASGNVHLWSVDREQCSLRWLGTSFSSECEQFAFSPDGQVLVLLDHEHGEAFIQIRTGRVFESGKRLVLPRSWRFLRGPTNICFSPNGRYLAIGEYDGTVGFWDLWRQVPIGTFRAYLDLSYEAAPFPTLTGLDWSSSGLLATAGFDPLDETYAYQNNFVANLWHIEIAEEGERE